MLKVCQLDQISIKLCQEDQKQKDKRITTNALYRLRRYESIAFFFVCVCVLFFVFFFLFLGGGGVNKDRIHILV